MGVIIFYIKNSPFEDRTIGKLEIFNEFCILSINYCLFLLTDFMPDLTMQYHVGWAIICATILNTLVNMVFMVI